MSELKPCPFCGGKAQEFKRRRDNACVVVCSCCHPQTRIVETGVDFRARDVAKYLWNKRVSENDG